MNEIEAQLKTDETKLTQYLRMLDSLPKDERAEIAKILLRGDQNPEHITKQLENEQAATLLEDRDKTRSLVLALAVIIASSALAALVLVLYRGQPDMALKIILPVITFIAGAGGGYGIGSGKSKRSE